jgi:CrcB protein
MIHVFYIGLGGFIGAISRYFVSRFLNNLFSMFPMGTLTVNVLGSLILGFIMYSLGQGKSIPVYIRDMITIGFIGAFTTMSTFSYETFRLAELNEILYSGVNLILNIFLCLLAVYFGKEAAILISK